MLQDIFDREGNIIGSVETVRMETKYGDGRGHVVEVVVTDDLSMSDFRGMDLRNANFHGMDIRQTWKAPTSATLDCVTPTSMMPT